MPLESATTINELVTSNPTTADGVSQGDDHLRLLKSTIKATFPNITAPVTSTNAEIDAAVAVNKGVSPLLVPAATGVAITGDTDTAIYSPGEDQLTLKTNAVDRLKVKADGSIEATGALTVDGALAAVGPLTGPGALPIGGTLIWWSDTLPTGYGTFAWLNGGTYPRSNTVLWNLFGTTYGVGDGSTTANLPDVRDSVLVGKGTMGGTTAVGRITNFVTSTLGNLFGECLHLLGITEVPPITPTGTVTLNQTTEGGTYTGLGVVSSFASAGLTRSGFNVTAAFHGDSFGGGQTHNNVQPSIVCNMIIRTA